MEKNGLTRKKFIKKTLRTGAVIGGGAALGYGGVKLWSALSNGTNENSAGYGPKPNFTTSKKQLPNIVIIHTDDLGYGDLGCYGAKSVATPNIDRLARQGMRFTDFYSCNALCSPSRCGLLTGRYPQRVGMHWVLWMEDLPFFAKMVRKAAPLLNKIGASDVGAPSETKGLPPGEITIAEALQAVGYKTGCIGKWHQGDFRFLPEYNPVNHGFDHFYGMPWDHEETPCPLYHNKKLIKEDWDDLSEIHQVLADGACDFINNAGNGPFFLYYAPPDPHIPLHPSKKFKGKSRGGLYGDVVEELDANVGQVLRCLKKNGYESNTLVIFASDNGPWYHGSTGGQRGRKGQSYEGGFNVPMIARWPGKIKAGSVCSEPSINLDLLPTCLSIAGINLPGDRIIDGENIAGLLTGKVKKSPHDALYFYHHDQLEGIRVGKWKYYTNISTYTYPVPVDKNHFAKGYPAPWLYNLELDPTESYSLTESHPEIVKEMESKIQSWNKAMKKNPRGLL